MIHSSGPVQTVHHCYGVILHHHEDWWLVEFPENETNPSRAIQLTGNITPDLAARVRKRARDKEVPATVAAFIPQNKCWHGEFSLIRSDDEVDRFDIGDYNWGAEIDEPEVRLARTMIDSMLFPIPAGFISVLGALPDENVPVLAVRASGYTCATFELLTARYMPSYRPRSAWRDISNDAVTDSGSDILGWMPATDWIRPK